MSFTDEFSVRADEWQLWLDGRLALSTDDGALIPLADYEERLAKEAKYRNRYDFETDECWLPYYACCVTRADMDEGETINRAAWYDGQATGEATCWRLRLLPGNALTIIAYEEDDSTVTIWVDSYDV